MDFNTSLRRAIKTGKVILGQNETKDSIEKGSAKLIVVAANCPSSFPVICWKRELKDIYL